MIDLNRAMKHDRLMKALTGLTVQEFRSLLPSFTAARKERAAKQWKKRQKHQEKVRKPGGGAHGHLEADNNRLFFILFYYKCYPTMDVTGMFFNLDRSNVKRQVDKLTLTVEHALGRKMVLPKRKIKSMEEFFQAFPDVKDIFVDGTERPHHRPKADKQKQKDLYSGKKKRHTVKNTMICTQKKEIGFLGKTVPGTVHDLKDLTNNFSPGVIPPGIAAWLDMGFEGIGNYLPDLLCEKPKRKPRNKELTEKEKKNNAVISGIRIIVEHAIGGVKRYGITTQVFRNKSEKFNDRSFLIACGLWNYHLKSC